jgi:hypothetical protein
MSQLVLPILDAIEQGSCHVASEPFLAEKLPVLSKHTKLLFHFSGWETENTICDSTMRSFVVSDKGFVEVCNLMFQSDANEEIPVLVARQTFVKHRFLENISLGHQNRGSAGRTPAVPEFLESDGLAKPEFHGACMFRSGGAKHNIMVLEGCNLLFCFSWLPFVIVVKKRDVGTPGMPDTSISRRGPSLVGVMPHIPYTGVAEALNGSARVIR